MNLVGRVASSGVLALAVLAACERSHDKAGPREFRLPTAMEVFNLRTKCAELGEALLANPPTNTPVAENNPLNRLASHYVLGTNRCYVRISTPSDLNHSELEYLFDGQTKELLAYTDITHGQTAGVVLPNARGLAATLGIEKNFPDSPAKGYDFVQDFINKAMADDRKQ